MTAAGPVRRLKDAVNRIRFRPYRSLTTAPVVLGDADSISDLFVYRGDLSATQFVAENTLALLTAAPVPVVHRLHFFDPEGQPCGEQIVRSTDYFTTITIQPLAIEYGTFVHSTAYDEAEIEANRSLDRSLLQLQRLHRGYALYQRTPQSVFAAVHGNFGGIVTRAGASRRRHRLLARRRAHFLYTPQHRFSPQDRATLFVMNSCPTREIVEVLGAAAGSDDSHPLVLDVPPLGVRRCRLEGVDGYLSIRSRLPSCRPLIFVETDSNPHHFDVFHT